MAYALYMSINMFEVEVVGRVCHRHAWRNVAFHVVYSLHTHGYCTPRAMQPPTARTVVGDVSWLEGSAVTALKVAMRHVRVRHACPAAPPQRPQPPADVAHCSRPYRLPIRQFVIFPTYR